MPEKDILYKEEDIKQVNYFKYVWYFLRRILIIAISLGLVVLIALTAYNFVNNNYLKPVDIIDTEGVKVEIKMGTSVTGIATQLYETGLIRNKGVFKLYVDLSNSSGKLRAGKYVLKKTWTMDQIIEELMTGTTSIAEKTITIPEGKTIEWIAEYLTNKENFPDFEFTKEEFLENAKVEYFTEYAFLLDISEERLEGDYPLEGYLFPDTYSVFVDSTVEQIIIRMLNQFDKVFNEEYKVKAEELGMTIDEVVTLASIVQGEARVALDFPRIAAVFLNRLEQDVKLGSCATVVYAKKIEKVEGYEINTWTITGEDLAIDNPHNTYKYGGLPFGPIGNPGDIAIKAVLFPNEKDIKDGMLFFVLKDPKTGSHAFNKTNAAHEADSVKYRKIWEKYEKEQKAKAAE